MNYLHRVESKRQPQGGTKLTTSSWKGNEFTEADGTVCVVSASGKMPTKDWPNGSGCSLHHLQRRTIGHPVVTP